MNILYNTLRRGHTTDFTAVCTSFVEHVMTHENMRIKIILLEPFVNQNQKRTTMAVNYWDILWNRLI